MTVVGAVTRVASYRVPLPSCRVGNGPNKIKVVRERVLYIYIYILAFHFTPLYLGLVQCGFRVACQGMF
jgi:hypothetical protein